MKPAVGEPDRPAQPADQVWDSRAAALVASMSPVIAWARERQGVRIDTVILTELLSLSSLETVLLDRMLPVPGLDGEVGMVDLDSMPEDIFTVLGDYMAGTPVWFGQRCSKSPRHELVRQQHLLVLCSVQPHLPALLA